ncbi:MAG: PrsW family glutamic-type intramembrane protease [Streptosporangiaceae bacterium]
MTIAGSITLVRITAAVVCAFGAVVLAWQFFRYLTVLPGDAAVAIAVELPLVVVGCLAARRLRPVHPPALIWSAAAVIWGAAAATGCALLANEGLTGLWAKSAGPAFAATWSASLSAPFNEELLKVCGVVMVVLAAPQVIRGPLDGMVIGAMTGLGFQAAENVTYGLNAVALGGAADPAGAVLRSAGYRIGVTGLGSHWAMTAVAGAGVGYLVRRGRAGLPPAVTCLLASIAMHLLFDAPYVPLPAKVGVNVAAVATLYLVLRRRYAIRARGFLAGRVEAGVLTSCQAAELGSRRGRRQAAGRATSGAERDLLQTRQQRELAELDAAAA